MDDATNEVMGKLMREGVPVSFDRYRYEIEDLENQIEGLKQVSKRGKVRAISKLVRKPIDKRAEGLREAIGTLRKEGKAEGMLTQLTERDIWECRYQYTAKRLYHQRLADGDKLEDKAYMAAHLESVDAVSTSVMIAAQVMCALKKKDKVNGQWVRMFSFDEITDIDPRLHLEIWAVYKEQLMVTQAQLKKSSASTIAKDQARETATSRSAS